MSDINEMKLKLETMKGFGSITKGDILDLITTIESQKEEIEALNWKIAHPVSCRGICTSQHDDYCGMHMSNETCIACNRIWTNAHVENAIFDSKAITELAVKGLKDVSDVDTSSYHNDTWQMRDIANAALSEIEKLQNG